MFPPPGSCTSRSSSLSPLAAVFRPALRHCPTSKPSDLIPRDFSSLVSLAPPSFNTSPSPLHTSPFPSPTRTSPTLLPLSTTQVSKSLPYQIVMAKKAPVLDPGIFDANYTSVSGTGVNIVHTLSILFLTGSYLITSNILVFCVILPKKLQN